MSAAVPCANPDPHGPHYWRLQGDYGTHNLNRCPGIDPTAGLAPERDRPTWDIPDLTPQVLLLTDAAALIIRAFNDGQPSASYHGMIAVWCTLCDMSEPEALTFAYQIAFLTPPTQGTVIPL